MTKQFEFEKLKIPSPDIWPFQEIFNFSNSIFFLSFLVSNYILFSEKTYFCLTKKVFELIVSIEKKIYYKINLVSLGIFKSHRHHMELQDSLVLVDSPLKRFFLQRILTCSPITHSPLIFAKNFRRVVKIVSLNSQMHFPIFISTSWQENYYVF